MSSRLFAEKATSAMENSRGPARSLAEASEDEITPVTHGLGSTGEDTHCLESSRGMPDEAPRFHGKIEFILPLGYMGSTSTGAVRYSDLSDNHKRCIDCLRAKINKMPKRKLLDCLKREIAVDEIMPLILLDRDSVVELLNIGQTTFKRWIHEGLGMERWPARAVRAHHDRWLKCHKEEMDELYKSEPNFDAQTLKEKREQKEEAWTAMHKLGDDIRQVGHAFREKHKSTIME